jgi:hypothetical protein
MNIYRIVDGKPVEIWQVDGLVRVLTLKRRPHDRLIVPIVEPAR